MSKQQNIEFTGFGGGHFSPTNEFKHTFPKMTELLGKALVVDFAINRHQRFRQYIWAQENSKSIGWLCRLEHCVPQGRNIIPEHILLSNTVGGIVEYWIDDKSINVDTFIDNNHFTFSLPDTHSGIGGWEEHYISDCANAGFTPLETKDFVTFALEANGNTTFYHKDTKEVFFFAHDGYSPIDIALLEGQPDYTIHKFDSVTTFVDYAEALATQWLSIISK
jgi:hypothetical protein